MKPRSIIAIILGIGILTALAGAAYFRANLRAGHGEEAQNLAISEAESGSAAPDAGGKQEDLSTEMPQTETGDNNEIMLQTTVQYEIDSNSIRELKAEMGERYYYSLLEDARKTDYLEIALALREQQEFVWLQDMDADTMNRVYQSVLMDFPEYFWCEGAITYYDFKELQVVKLLPQYNCEGEEKARREEVIHAAVSQVLSQMPETEDEYDKIRYIYEYVINHTDYQDGAAESQNIYSVFGNGQSVCAGYAKATQYLLNQAGIFGIYVTGTIADGGSHAWNIVRCNGSYYEVDTTWGDPVYLGTMEHEELQGNIGYEFLCCSETFLSRTHIANPNFTLPACTETNYEYYRMLGRYFEAVDEEALVALMQSDIDVKAERTDVQFSDEGVYQQAVEACENRVFEKAARHLAERYGLESVSYRYQKVDATGRVTVMWDYD